MHNKYYLTEEQIELIHKVPLFRSMSDDFKNTLFEKLDYTVTELQKGDIIIKQDTPCLHLHILLKGNLEVNIIDVSGNNVKVENIIAPKVFAAPHLFSGNDIFPATFTVVEEGSLFRATKESVFKLISSNPELLKNFLKIRGNCNACTIGRLRILSYKTIRSRFIYYLVKRKDDDNLIILEHNQTQLAEYLNVSRPALAKEIKSMVDEESIQIDGKTVIILKLSQLLKYI